MICYLVQHGEAIDSGDLRHLGKQGRWRANPSHQGISILTLASYRRSKELCEDGQTVMQRGGCANLGYILDFILPRCFLFSQLAGSSARLESLSHPRGIRGATIIRDIDGWSWSAHQTDSFLPDLCLVHLPWSRMKGPLDLFTSIHVHGLAYDANGESSPLTLDRSISFPSPTWTCGNPGEPFFKSLPSRALPTQGYTLEARISPRKSDIISMTTGKSEDGFLGDGRSSFVYSLDIIAIRPSGPTSDEDPLPLDDPIFKKLPPLCIKVAKPTYSRSLAREAWFYEKLDESQLTGVVTPHSYGLFCGGPHNRAPKPQSSGIDRMNSFGCLELNIPMYDVVLDQHFAANPRGASLLPEETGRYKCLDDDQSSYGSSPWFLFRETKDTINPTVLLLEQLPSERKADCENDL